MGKAGTPLGDEPGEVRIYGLGLSYELPILREHARISKPVNAVRWCTLDVKLQKLLLAVACGTTDLPNEAFPGEVRLYEVGDGKRSGGAELPGRLSDASSASRFTDSRWLDSRWLDSRWLEPTCPEARRRGWCELALQLPARLHDAGRRHEANTECGT